MYKIVYLVSSSRVAAKVLVVSTICFLRAYTLPPVTCQKKKYYFKRKKKNISKEIKNVKKKNWKIISWILLNLTWFGLYLPKFFPAYVSRESTKYIFRKKKSGNDLWICSKLFCLESSSQKLIIKNIVSERCASFGTKNTIWSFLEVERRGGGLQVVKKENALLINI